MGGLRSNDLIARIKKQRRERRFFERMGFFPEAIEHSSGSVAFTKAKMLRELQACAPIQWLLFNPVIEIRRVSPGVAVAYLVGMKFISVKTAERIQRVAEETMPIGSQIILTVAPLKG